MSDKTITVNIPLTEEKLQDLIEFSMEHNVSAEQMASQVVQQWVTTLRPRYSHVD